ncbi:MAG: hypothetical protein M0020_03080 [Actinomycetota bacterium]|nr:hypothetical protein [Actinomycetota bacterium]
MTPEPRRGGGALRSGSGGIDGDAARSAGRGASVLAASAGGLLLSVSFVANALSFSIGEMVMR